MKLSIVSPSYNEVKNLNEFVDNIQGTLNTKLEKFEIIIVDDNSQDGSKQVLELLEKKYNNFRYLIRTDAPRDLSKSCLLGFEHAIYENILVLDCDLQHNPKDIIKIVDEYALGNSNVVVGARKLYSKIDGLSILRQLASIVIVFVLNTLLKKYTNDPMSGFFLFKKEIYLNSNSFFSKGFKILIDLIYNSKENIKLKDVYIDFNHRKANKSKMNFKILIYIIEFIIKHFFKRILK